jgi:hypothetical protein
MGRREDVEFVHLAADPNVFDVKELRKDRYDICLLYEGTSYGLPDKLKNIEKREIPWCVWVGDAHYRAEYKAAFFRELHVKHCAYIQGPKYFYVFYPKEFEYEFLPLGVEWSLFEEVRPWEERIEGKILNTGSLAKGPFYGLRRAVNDFSFVEYRGKGKSTFGDRYVETLSRFQGAVAACSVCPVNKFLEIPAAGCVAFMECTEENEAELLGFPENSVVRINEDTAYWKMWQFLDDDHSPYWEKVAAAGREYVRLNYTNDKCAERMVRWLERIAFPKECSRERE